VGIGILVFNLLDKGLKKRKIYIVLKFTILLKTENTMKNNTKQYLSPRETEVIARLSYEKASLLTQEQFDKYFKFPKRVREKILFRLKKKGILIAVKKGIYFYLVCGSCAY
jgi:predicted transcriptional regulator of viral defense system